LQVNNPHKKTESKPQQSSFDEQKKLVEALKVQWKLMWNERFNDKAKAEGVSVADYESLMVERGTVIHATRDFKALSFKEIVKQNMIKEPERFIQPDVNVGGWNKFIKTKIHTCSPKKNKRAASYVPEKTSGQQPKKNGRGWLHTT
jgi:hypothetical protein